MEENPRDEKHTENQQNPEGHTNENGKPTSRRDFMKNLGLLGAGAVTGAAALYSGHIFEVKKEKSKDAKVL